MSFGPHPNNLLQYIFPLIGIFFLTRLFLFPTLYEPLTIKLSFYFQHFWEDHDELTTCRENVFEICHKVSQLCWWHTAVLVYEQLVKPQACLMDIKSLKTSYCFLFNSDKNEVIVSDPKLIRNRLTDLPRWHLFNLCFVCEESWSNIWRSVFSVPFIIVQLCKVQVCIDQTVTHVPSSITLFFI